MGSQSDKSALHLFLRTTVPSLLVLWLSIAVLLYLSLKHTQGHLVYTLDDPYIHMAIAKNFASYTVWSIDGTTFTPATSSMLWTFMLSVLFYLFGPNPAVPFVLNILFATLSVMAAFYWLRSESCPAVQTAVVLLAMVLLTPLPPIAFSGLEHTAQIFLALLFVHRASRYLEDDCDQTRGSAGLILLAALQPLVRYEGVFIVVTFCVLFTAKRRMRLAILMAAVSAAPVVAHGILSVSEGWSFIPNPLLLKGFRPHNLAPVGLMEWLVSAVSRLHRVPHVWVMAGILMLSLRLFWQTGHGLWGDSRLISAMAWLITALQHCLFADFGYFFRYEAYLVAWGIVSVGSLPWSELGSALLRGKARDAKWVTAALIAACVLVAIPFIYRGTKAFSRTPVATQNIYEQQIQMGLFLNRFYKGDSVMVNDVGAVAFLTNNMRVLDLEGLANRVTGNRKLSGRYDTDTIRQLSNMSGAPIAIVYEHWFNGKHNPRLPEEWLKVGAWSIKDNVVCGGYQVAFYAATPQAAKTLSAHLEEFSKYLPTGVEQTRTADLPNAP